MIVLVCGGRDYTNRARVFDVLDKIHRYNRITKIVEGGQRTYKYGKIVGGADYFGALWARQVGCEHKPVPADWEAHGKAAGMIRNQKMLDEQHPDLIVAFPGGRGTANMKQIARAQGYCVVDIA